MFEQAFTVARRYRIALFSLIGLVVLLGAAFLAASFAIGYFGERALRAAGFAHAEMAGVRLALDGVRIRRLRLAGDGRFVLRGVAVHFSWESLRAGRARRLSISDARLEAALSPAGALQLPAGLAAKLGAQSKGHNTPTGIPVDTVTLDTATVQLATPTGKVELTLKQAHARLGDTVIHLDSALRMHHAAGTARGHLQATVRWPGGPVSLRLAIVDGEINAVQTHLAGLRGEVRAMLSAHEPLIATLDLTAAQSTYCQLALGALNLSARLAGKQVRYRLSSPPASSAVFDLGGKANLDARRATLEGRVRVPSLARLPRLKAGGHASLTSKLAFDWGVNPPRLTGQLALEADGLVLDGLVQEGRLQFASEIDATPGRIVLTARAPWKGQAILASRLLPRALQSYAGDLLQLRFGPNESAGAVHLTIRPAAGRAVLETTAVLAIGETRLQSSAALRLQVENDAVTMVAKPLTLSFSALRLGGLTVGLAGFTGRAALEPDRSWQLEGAGRLTALGDIGPVTVGGARLAWSGRLEGDRRGVRVIPTECLSVVARAVTVHGRRFESLDLPCFEQQAGAPLLRYTFGPGRLYVAAASERAPLDLRIRAAEKLYSVEGQWPVLTIQGQGGAQGLGDLRVNLRGGRLRLVEAQLAAEGIAGTLALSGGAIEEVRLTASAVKSLAQPALWVPLQLEATATPKGGELVFDAVLSDALGIVVLQAKGQTDQGKTRAALTLSPIQFIPEATGPDEVSPALGALAKNSDMAGTVGFHGRLVWDGKSLTSSGRLRLDELAATVAGLQFEGLNGTVAFASLVPPITDHLQTLHLAAANVGLPLTDGRVRLALRPGGRLRVAELAFAFAGGQLRAEPFRLNVSQRDDLRITLHAKQVDLAKVLRMSGIMGVEAKGELTGRVPISLGSDALRIAGGRLQATGGGVLRYVPQEMPDFLEGDDLHARMLRRVLKNFHYKQLLLTLVDETGAAGTERHVHLEARGANPDFLGGHPLVLNMHVGGPLGGIVKSAVSGIGAKALERMFEDSEP